jgi:hypothetical protein
MNGTLSIYITVIFPLGLCNTFILLVGKYTHIVMISRHIKIFLELFS